MVKPQRERVVIENVRPCVSCGRFAAKRTVGDRVAVTADVFADGHDVVAARLLYRPPGSGEWTQVPMEFTANDTWKAEFAADELGVYRFTVEGWIDHFASWRDGFEKKYAAGQDVSTDILVGAEIVGRAARKAGGELGARLTEIAEIVAGHRDREKGVSMVLGPEVETLMRQNPDREFAARFEPVLRVQVDRPRAAFSTWYELFPRSASPEPGRPGTLRDVEALLPEISRMGFDVLYLPPIHPIGETNRKGANNSPLASSEDPGSPWAIGSGEGGHKSIDPALGTMADFERLAARASDLGMEIALDLAFQCSPDHPYVKEHPGWFRTRPDGSVQYAENPPKKYEDIFPFDFETEEWPSLWEELKSIALFWIGKGVRIFRVDNPHTKPFGFWEWFLHEIRKDNPEVLFLAEAFTRPKVMKRLAKAGFSQSYTYFTWRNHKEEITGYLRELTESGLEEYFRPNFWPNTPDILSEYLQYGGRAAFVIRLILAATLSSNYGIFGPAFELMENAALPGREEYLDSEKYAIRRWDWDRPGNLKDFIARINRIRRENPALQKTKNLRFFEVDNDRLLFFGKIEALGSDSLFAVVNLDPGHVQSGWLRVPLWELGMDPAQPYLGHDLLSDDKYIWYGERNFVQLDPQVVPAHIFKLRARVRREVDFDYFM